ncbi:MULTISPECIES: flavodoxin [unclassified Campylobacter]|uniref:flavodoxin n=1 Tax=unclassified Campylobacter TaxID=2593542 RepID=UPI0022E9AAA3|nr:MULTISPECIES: flavodoxin [unclassified Campylobacter]MDA3043785.1 SUMF1/EgtB/PvdO family nonheme iron enzyme [Campylobacter sp. JMF_09 ED2]MDA3044060.1 SUMF1/EgtB/PvdO family nonheme iron enzyme [Campylobacter sp. JMF_07 ED4]MDA3064005.1 SUMF1/EgtB/PvdO family nonheme iron enzyme [Campylobacter sp. JMF_11 EL3]MDA3072395.1 SUMF1/EgtB/PvdO family nonheme iron enzyme [Campylobacter sp. VBCF_03 NA9]MDA3074964.1 SUMF1/EgtB/PvdO family nonheme iron enzyme [Campylobacter sp. JMF_05 ED3]
MKKFMPIFALLAIFIFGGLIYNFTGSKKGNIIENTATASVSNENENLEKLKALDEKSKQILSDTQKNSTNLDKNFVLIKGGNFIMGSEKSENWRSDDEMAHEVGVSDFYIGTHEITQGEYERITGVNPSENKGVNLPVENVSWLDAVMFANLKSLSEGLNPAYEITPDSVIWDRGANGYRLPSEAEWEYAARAGTSTPFSSEIPPSGNEANFYSNYPYEIEENYFDNSKLKAKPTSPRYRTIEVGSFAPNGFGLFDIHGNVNEWCWDFYGAYESGNALNPTGASVGTRHVYRGGGWNDFGKNLRSAYRAAAQSNYKNHNLGIRLARNAENSPNLGKIEAKNESFIQSKHEKILIVFYSWGGNTRGIAREIRKITGADIFEIRLETPYSDDYNTCLMQAQSDQHKNARPKIDSQIKNFEQYDTILLGYPNWWASIPMPIATLLQSYDFNGKMIIPFASHGGGRMGASVTAIAKLAPNSPIGNALSVHYSGGATLGDDIRAWLNANEILVK